MRLYEKMTGRDRLKLFFMWTLSVGAAVSLQLYQKMELSKIAVSVFFILLFSLAFSWMLVQEYTIDETQKHLHDTLTRISIAYTAGVILTVAAYLLPVRIHVMLAVSMLINAVVSPLYGLCLSLFLSVLLSINQTFSGEEVSYIVFLCIMGTLLTPLVIRKKYRIFSGILVGALSVTGAFLYGYMLDGQILPETVLKGAGEAVLNIGTICAGIPLLLKKKKEREVSSYARAMEDSFPLAQFMHSLSDKRYVRCRFVSKVCMLCARQVEFDEEFCGCAGFYYDLCDNDEPDAVFYATNLGKRNLLPIDVVRILSQYHGSVCPIVTREAALVDLVYETVRSLENVSDEAETFEKEMAVHSVFNDLSKNGRYDESGLSMNQFLKLRNFLIKEVERL